jgi:hypothetical protein
MVETLGGCTSRCRSASGEVAGSSLDSRVEESGRATSIEASAVLMRGGNCGSLPGSLLPRCSWPIGAHQLSGIQRTLAGAKGTGVVLGLIGEARRREGEIPNCSGRLHHPGKPAFLRLGILPQQLRTFPFVRNVHVVARFYQLAIHFAQGY